MSFSYETQGANTYLVYQKSDDDVFDSTSKGMLTHNRKIAGLAPTSFSQMNTEEYIKYNISSKVSVQHLFDSPVSKKRLIGVLMGIADAMISAEEYMIDPSFVILDNEYIFSDVSTGETVLICLPIKRESGGNESPSQFIKQIMFRTQFDQMENCDYVAKILSFLNSAPSCAPQELKALLLKIGETETTGGGALRYAQPQASGTQDHKSIMPPHPYPEHVPGIPAAGQPGFGVKGSNEIQVIKENPTDYESTSNDGKLSTKKKSGLLNLFSHSGEENAAHNKKQKAAQKEAATETKNTKKKTGSTMMTGSGVPNGMAIPGQSAPIMPPQQVQTEAKTAQGNSAAAVQITLHSARAAEIHQVSNDFGGTQVLDDGVVGETTVLVDGTTILNDGKAVPAGQHSEPPAYLVRIKTGEKIYLNKPVFRIGRQYGYADYCIADNPTIGRSHANFVMRGKEFFIIDINSKNHVYINGAMIASSTEVQIKNGDRICLSDENFDFIVC